ncbi:MAG: bifunctional UDP-N-acetylmuramoyl-tripeptide:D-alanyl-D-alanine ligase/alanine racemase, partial [Cyclobacteriaceae bacterium]|nr:bifunctional UDP-N-acetylmuramoyl-tripeptide:D-alanyl-D-alanine ligase/alanine racemase [Cyclobacteriaceae bacterium]
MHFSELAPICRGTVIQLSLDRPIQTLLIDSRKAVVSEGSLFFAIRGERHDGHSHLEELYKLGIRQFVVEKKIDGTLFPDANILHVTSSVDVLQAVAAHHRQQYNILVVGITGSNGKTIIKEWLSQALAADYHLVKNPGSYNSQVGVPLSVWQMQGHHQLGIFEAGISRPGEMQHLQKIIRPTIGIFTNVGSAHDEGFADRKQKAEEKMQLFSNCEHLIYCADHELVDEIVRERNIPSLTWGHSAKADISIKLISENEFEIRHQAHSFHLQLPFADAASQENAFHVMAFLLFMKYTPAVIQERISALKSVPMRLELKQGINRCTVIDDSYNNDLA